MRVLHCASECAPLVKTGGLGDVIGALPNALRSEGVEARVLLPGYPAVLGALEEVEDLGPVEDLPGGPARLRAGSAAGFAVYALDAPQLYDRPGGIYDRAGVAWPDNHVRFGALSRAAATLATEGVAGWRPDILHLHDWQAALAAAYLVANPDFAPATVVTIHNIAFQGLFPPEVIGELGLPPEGFRAEGYEFWGQVGFLKAGLKHADRITTVSPGYAREIMTPQFGLGLEGLLLHRRHDVVGILNGVDVSVWNPETDTHIPQGYSSRALKGKGAARRALAERCGFDPDAPGPILVVVSRFTRQKGLDLLLDALPRFLEGGGRVAAFGSGEAEIEDAFVRAAAADPSRVATVIGYDEPLAHLMIAGGDAIAVPSRFEPCGLTQLYGLRYGTLPVVARTGGLGDTIIDANPAAISLGAATGFQFTPGDSAALAGCLDRLLDIWTDQPLWRRMMRRAMTQSLGWEVSARAYTSLYASLIDEAGGAAGFEPADERQAQPRAAGMRR